MSGPWEQYGSAPGGDDGPWQQFAAPAAPKKIGAAAQDDFLRAEMRNAAWFTRNLAGAGTALSDLWERGKQLVGRGDEAAIQANKVMAEEAPVGAVLGNGALAAVPFGLVGNSVKAATAVGAGLGFAKPVAGEQSFENIAKGTAKNVALDSILGGVGQKVANLGGQYVSRKLSDLSIQKQRNGPIDKTIGDALDNGLTFVPSDVNPTLANTVKESFAGKAAVGQAVSNKNSPIVDNLARRAIGLADDVPLEPGVLKAVRDDAYATGYKPIANMPVLTNDGMFVRQLATLSPVGKGGAVKNPAEAEAQQLLSTLANRGEWSGGQLIADIRALREQSKANFREGTQASTTLARAQSGSAKLLEELAERNIMKANGSPQAVQEMRAARTKIARAHDVEDALVEGGGTLDARVLARKLQNGDPLEGELRVIASFANNFKRAVQPQQMVNGGAGVSKLDATMATGGGILGSMLGPVGTAVGAAAPFVVPRALRAEMMTRRSQNQLRRMYELGLPTRAANGLLDYLPVGSTVLGSQALSK